MRSFFSDSVTRVSTASKSLKRFSYSDVFASQSTPNLPPIRGDDITLGTGNKAVPAPTQAPRKLSPDEAAAEKASDEAMIKDRKEGAGATAAKHTHNYFDQWDAFNVDKELENLDDESEDEEEEEVFHLLEYGIEPALTHQP